LCGRNNIFGVNIRSIFACSKKQKQKLRCNTSTFACLYGNYGNKLKLETNDDSPFNFDTWPL